jgi:hypothetical protein
MMQGIDTANKHRSKTDEMARMREGNVFHIYVHFFFAAFSADFVTKNTDDDETTAPRRKYV